MTAIEVPIERTHLNHERLPMEKTYTVELTLAEMTAIAKSLGISLDQIAKKLTNIPERLTDTVKAEYAISDAALDVIRTAMAEAVAA